MADNIPIRDNSNGSNADFAQLLASFAENNGELRDILRTLNTTLTNIQRNNRNNNNSSQNYDRIVDREIQTRLKNIKSLENYTNSFDETQRILRQVGSDLNNSSKDIQKSGLGDTVGKLNETLQDYSTKVNDNINSTTDEINKSRERIIKIQNHQVKLEAKLEEAKRKGWTRVVQRIEQERATAEQELRQRRNNIKETEANLAAEMAQKNKVAELYKQHAKSVADSIQSMTTLNSEYEKFKPENAKRWDSFTQSVSDYLRPKQSAEYKESKARFNERREYLDERRVSLANLQNDNKTEYETLLSDIEYNKIKAKELIDNGDSASAYEYEEKIKQLEGEKEVLEAQTEIIKSEFELIDRETEFLDDAEQKLENSTSVGMNLLSSGIKGIQKFVTRAVDRELDNLSSAASEIFTSFETLQKSLGKQLKLSSGAYEDMKDMLMEAADAAGKAIDITQLNEAAASISEMGITNKDLITQMAVGVAKFSESGVSAQLDEETAKQINATFQTLKTQGYSDTEAAQLATQRFDDIIAIEEKMRQEYDNVLALENGGWQDIQNWTNRFKATNDITTVEQEREFMASMADAMGAMATYGIQDPTAIFTDIESIIQGTMTDIPAYLQGWLNTNNMGITNTEEMYKAMGSGQVGDITMSLLEYLSNWSTSNATYDAYSIKSLGIQFTPEQMRAFNSNYENIQSSYNKTDFSEESLNAVGRSVQRAIDKGSLLTATESLEKTNKSLMQELASEFQDIPDGAFWMGQGFDVIRGIVDGAMTHLFEFLTAAFAGQSLFGGGAGGTGGLGGFSNIFKSGLLGGAQVTNAGFTTSSFAGHEVNAAGKLTMAAGGIMSAASAIENFTNAENFEDGMINTFRDPQFTSGLGMTIGGAIGGPIGGAVGGLLGQFIPAVSEGLENWLIKADPFGWIDDTADVWESNAEKIAAASESLQMAADSHNSNAEKMENDLNSQMAIFNQYSEDQKIAFAQQMGLISSQESYIGTEQDTNELFDKAVQEWIKQQQEAIEQERALERGASLVEDTLAQVIGVDNGTNFSASEMTEDKYRNQAWAERVGLNWDEVKNLSDEDLAAKFQEAEEHYANVRGVLSNDSGSQLITDIENYASTNGIEDFSTAAEQYLQKIDPELYQGEQMETAKATLTEARDLKAEYDVANKSFHEKFQKILDDNPGITNYGDLFKLYKEANPNFDYEAIEGLTWDATGNVPLVNGSMNISTALPDLRHSSRTAFAKAGNLASKSKLDYAKELYDGKFKTGLDYVPVDDYMALLHQGEMVLNQTQADEYRKSSGGLLNSLVNMSGTVQDAVQTSIQNITSTGGSSVFDISSITNSVNSQTDRIEALLTKILQVLTSKSNSGSNLPRSLVQMNSDISLL